MLSPQYLAGFFDGEGMVSICYVRKRIWKSDPTKKTFGFRAVVGIANTHKPILELIKQEFGGDMYLNKRTNPNWQPVWAWKLTGKNAQIKFLQFIEPFVVVKRQPVLLGLQYLSTVGKIGSRTSQDDWDTRIAIHDQLRKLNRPGYPRRYEPIPVEAIHSAGRNTRYRIQP
jgi:hypothetical protein